MDLLGILLIGLLAMFVCTAGFVAVGLFGAGAVIYGIALLGSKPIAALGWIAVGLICCVAFSKIEKE